MHPVHSPLFIPPTRNRVSPAIILISLLIASVYIRFHFNLDLRKLIKHEERLAENARANHSGRNNLHKRGTVSSRAKLSGEKDQENAAPPLPSSSCASARSKESESKTDQYSQEQHYRTNAGSNSKELARLFKEKLLMEASVPPPGLRDLNPVNTVARGKRRSRSKTRQEKEPPLSSGGESDRNADVNRMQRRRRSKSRPRSVSRGAYLDRRCGRAKHCDPVSLFQYYQREWTHFRSQIPGESSRPSTRNEVRQKLMDLK